MSVNFGPLTLTEGWVTIDLADFENVVLDFASRFPEIKFTMDELPEERRRRQHPLSFN